jgi:hypothetical protein
VENDMKQPTPKKTAKPKKQREEQEILQAEDFQWLAEIHSVLSPFWSARSGYQNANSH